MNKIDRPREAAQPESGNVLQIRKIGNSLGLILPKELLAQLGFAEGDKLHAVRLPEGGVTLRAQEDIHARTMEIARQAMKEYASTLRELAK